MQRAGEAMNILAKDELKMNGIDLMGQQQPTFSIILPTYKRPRQLFTCLESLARLDYPRERFEVIVVDDDGNASPQAVVASFHHQLDITLLAQPHAGPAAARNTGAGKAKGRFLAFTDDDCQPAPDWLTTLAVRLAAMPDCAIGGRTINALPQNRYATSSQLLIDYLYSYYNAITNQSRFFTSSNLALPTDRFMAIGGFDTSFTRAGAEDREFCSRWLNHKYRMTYSPDAVVYHFHTLNFRTFWRQHFNYGRGAFHFHQVRARLGQEPLRLEPLSFYLNLLQFPFSQVKDRRALLLSALLVVTQAANAAGFFWEMRKRTRPDLIRDKDGSTRACKSVGRTILPSRESVEEMTIAEKR